MISRFRPLMPAAFTLLLAAVPSASLAQRGTPPLGDKSHALTHPAESLQEAAAHAVTVRLIADNESSVVSGGAGFLALTFDIEPDWHLYWHNPGDSGFPITWTLNAPPTLSLGPPQWPVPQRHLSPGDILDYIYEHDTTILIPFVASTDFKPGEPLTITAEVEWLVCREGCVPGGARTSLTIPTTPQPRERPESDDDQRLEKAKRRLPQPITSEDSQWLTTEWRERSLLIKARGAQGVTFYPYASPQAVPIDLVRRGMTTGDTLEILYRPSIIKAERVRGVVEVNRENQTRYYLVDLPPPSIP